MRDLWHDRQANGTFKIVNWIFIGKESSLSSYEFHISPIPFQQTDGHFEL